MDKENFLAALEKCLKTITSPRFYETERGYQGALNAALCNVIGAIIPEDYIVEEEYQKKIKHHGITLRPDIIIHSPFSPDQHKSRKDGNFVVILLKLNSTRGKSQEDFISLEKMFEYLNYPLGIFININSHQTHFKDYNGQYKERLYCYAVQLKDGEPEVVKN